MKKGKFFHIGIISGALLVLIMATASAAQEAPSQDEAIILVLQAPAYILTTEADGFTEIKAEGYSLTSNVGQPILPYRLMDVALPPDVIWDSLSINIKEGKRVVLPGTYNLRLGVPDQSIHGPAIDSRIVEQENTAIVQIVETGRMRKWHMARLGFWPFQYDPDTRQLMVVEQATVELRLSRSGNPVGIQLLADKVMDDLAIERLVNYQETQDWYPDVDKPSATTYDYVIITTKAIGQNSTKIGNFVSHKQLRGFNVLVVTEDDYGGLTGQSPNGREEKVRQWLINNYLDYGIKYVLLIGDPTPGGTGTTDLPMKMCWPRNDATSDKESPTDYFYADLTGNWNLDGDSYYGEFVGDYNGVTGGVNFMPEVYVGRIPFYDNYTDLDNILQKTIDYANETDIAWRDSILLPMGFQASGYDGAPLAEQMWDDYLNSAGYSRWRQYQQGNGPCGPDSIYTGDQELRGDNIVRDRWGGNDYGIVTWWGHGSATSTSVGYDGCWDGTLFDNTKTGSLDDDHPSFTYQNSCNNGWPENTNNLQYAILKQGGIATVSASRVSWFNPGIGYGAFDGSTTNSGIGYEYVDRLVQEMTASEALYGAKSSMTPTSNTRLMNFYDFNLYGDPLTSIADALLIPDPPTNVQASDGTYLDKVRVTWNASIGATSYIIFRATSAGGTQTNLGEVSSTTFDDTTATVGMIYYYWVSACGGVGCSLLSAYDTGFRVSLYLNYLPLVIQGASSGGWENIKTEDFEGSFPNEWDVNDYNSTEPGEYYWGKRNCEVYEGSYSGWAVGGGAQGSGLSCGSNYPDYTYSWMVYGPFSLATAVEAEMNFAFWLYSETDYDYIWYGASIDESQFYGTGWWGNSSGWVLDSFDLTNVPTMGDLTGQTQVWIAFMFYSDNMVNYPGGAFIDDIVLRKCDSGCGTSSPAAIPEGLEPVSLEVILKPEP